MGSNVPKNAVNAQIQHESLTPVISPFMSILAAGYASLLNKKSPTATETATLSILQECSGGFHVIPCHRHCDTDKVYRALNVAERIHTIRQHAEIALLFSGNNCSRSVATLCPSDVDNQKSIQGARMIPQPTGIQYRPSNSGKNSAQRTNFLPIIHPQNLFVHDHAVLYEHIYSNGRVIFDEINTRKKEMYSRRNYQILAAHAEAKKLWKAARAKADRDRLEALKADDFEGYIKLVQNAKNSRIESLLSQTDECLRKLTSRLVTGNHQSDTSILGIIDSSQAHTKVGNENNGMNALKQSTEAWNSIASALTAVDVTSQPKMLKGELREYQLHGLRWMLGLRENGLHGILADEMGLGKTNQVIALVAHCLEKHRETSKSIIVSLPPFLIVAPASVLPNWEKEITAWAPDLRIISYKGSAIDREDIYEKKIRPASRQNSKKGGGKFDVLLTTYDFLMGPDDRPRLSSIPWHYIIIDEGHRLKNAGCKLNAELAHYRASHRLLLTGTPLQNNLKELWTLLNFLMPDLFNSSDDFETWFGGAMQEKRDPVQTENEDSDGEDDAVHAAMLSEEDILIVTTRLHQVLRPFMLRRLKESVASELPAKIEHVLPCTPSPYQVALFSTLQNQLQGTTGVRGVNNVVMEMRNISNHPLISKIHIPGIELTHLPTNHPLPAEVRICAKLELLDRVLLKLKSSGHRTLIFCTMTRLLDVLEGYLEWRGLSFLRLDGATGSADRGALVEEFNKPDSSIFAFLLSIRAGGVGLNLQAADTIIFYDTDWNPSMDAQAAARAHRIGQTKQVLVLRLQTLGTVEEYITSVANQKRGLTELSINGGAFDGKTSATERQKRLLDLLKSFNKENKDKNIMQGNLSDSQLNRRISRSEEEFRRFEAEDAQRTKAELDSYFLQIQKSHDLINSTAGAPVYSRLATEQESQPMVNAVMASLVKPDPDAGKEFGRGKRARR